MKNVVAIESLRGWMAWWVVLAHALPLMAADTFIPKKIFTEIALGSVPVNVFIIISGFAIANLLMTKQESYRDYIIRRAFRIIPIYVVCLIASIVMLDLFLVGATSADWITWKTAWIARTAAAKDNFWTHLALHATLLHGMVPDSILPYAATTFLVPAWSLSLEWQFYLLAPIFIRLLAGRPYVMLATTAVSLALHVAFISGRFGIWSHPAFLPLAIQYFLIGIFTRFAMEFRWSGGRVPADLAVAAAVTVAFFAGRMELAIWSVFIVIALVELGRIEVSSPAFRWAAQIVALNPLVSEIGKWSYSTYLVHMLVYSAALGSVTLAFGPQSQVTHMVILIACWPVILIASKMLYEGIERRFIGYGRIVIGRTVTAPHAAE